MSKLFDKFFKVKKDGPATLDDRELLCDHISSTLSEIIEDKVTTKDKRLVVWLDCEKQIVFDQYNNKNYRELILANLFQKGFEFARLTFEKGKPSEDNHNVVKIGDNNLEYLEVGDCDDVQQSSVPKRAKLSIIEKLCVINPLQKEYLLSSEEIMSGRIPAYNIGRGHVVQKNGVYRENHIIFDDNPDSPLRDEYRCVSRSHAHIGYDAAKGFYFQVDEGGAYPGKTLLMNGGKPICCDCVNALFPLKTGDKIIVKEGSVMKAMLIYEELNK